MNHERQAAGHVDFKIPSHFIEAGCEEVSLPYFHQGGDFEISPEVRKEVSRISREVLDLYNLSGFVYVGTAPGLVGGEFSTASLAVAAFDFPGTEAPDVMAEGMLIDFLARHPSDWQGRLFDFPIGPAAVVAGVRKFDTRASVDEGESGGEGVVEVGELVSFVPLAAPGEFGSGRALCFCFSVARIDHWESLMPLAVSVFASLKFSNVE